MANYYEMLKIAPTASSQEIEAKLDEHYNYWRRQVTHHDIDVVNRANQALAALEKIRATLLDPMKREVYDVAIGVGGEQIAGLIDPDAKPLAPPVIPGASGGPITTPPSMHAMATARTDAWVCPKCQTPNSIGARHCKRCGQILAQNCPKCGTSNEIGATHCINCGVNIQQALREKQVKEEEERKRKEWEEAERRRADQHAAQQAAQNQQEPPKKGVGGTCLKMGVAGLFVMGCIIVASIFANGLFSSKNGSQNNGIGNNAPTATLVDPRIAAQFPVWSNESLQISARLYQARDDRFSIQIEIKNLSSSEQTVTFLTSDVIVTDDIGNVYPLAYGTDTIRDTLSVGSRSARKYEMSYEGLIPANATALNVKIAKLSGLSDLSFVLPLFNNIDQLINPEFTIGYFGNERIDIDGKFKSTSNLNFLLRWDASEMQLVDDQGNEYKVDDYDAGQFNYLFEHDNSWPMQLDISFVPGIDPMATKLTLTAPIMGVTYTETFELSKPADDLTRYEAQVSYVGNDSISVDYTVFNLSGQDFLVRFNPSQVYLLDSSGNKYFANTQQTLNIAVISSGSQRRDSIRFQGNPKDVDNLKLIFPEFSGVENVEVIVKPKE